VVDFARGARLPKSFAFAAIFLAIFSTCTTAMADQYYRVFSNAAIYIAWTQSGSGDIRGQVQMLSIGQSNPTQLQTTNASFTGVRNGRDISITFGLFSPFSGQTWTGTIGWGTLTLIVPTNTGGDQEVLYSGSFQQYAAAAQGLQRTVASSRLSASLLANLNEAAGHVNDDTQMIKRELATLAQMFPAQLGDDSLESQYARAWDKMRTDWSKEQSDADVTPMSCVQKSTVSVDASDIAVDLSSVQVIDSQTSSLSYDANSAFSSITRALADLSQWAPVYDERARLYSQVAGAPARPAIAQNLPGYSARIDRQKIYYKTRLASALAIAARYDAEAHDLNSKARSFADALDCTD
jgi:hypothetical protein